jgi:hypothetical protein
LLEVEALVVELLVVVEQVVIALVYLENYLVVEHLPNHSLELLRGLALLSQLVLAELLELMTVTVVTTALIQFLVL